MYFINNICIYKLRVIVYIYIYVWKIIQKCNQDEMIILSKKTKIHHGRSFLSYFGDFKAATQKHVNGIHDDKVLICVAIR